jgi:hypothetical protein
MTISKRKVVVEKKVILTLTLFAALISSTASTLIFVLEQQYKQVYAHSEKKLKDGEVMTQDLADDAVTGDKIEDGAVELSVETRAGPPTAIEPGGSGQAVAECDGGKVVVGVGFESDIGFQLNTS